MEELEITGGAVERCIGLYIGLPLGVWLEMQTFYDGHKVNAASKSEVVVQFLDCEKEFTYEEFFTRLGFTFDAKTDGIGDSCGVPLEQDEV